MKFNIISSVFYLLLACGSLMAQAPLKPCGTLPDPPEWLIRYQQNPDGFPKSNQVLYVPLTIHLVGSDEGIGFFPVRSMLDMLCQLNDDFAQTNIQFFLEGEIRFIYNSTYYDHTFSQGGQMMHQHYVPNTINCYVVDSPAGNCGYSSYGQGIALAKSCLNSNDHTWAHEIGHYLSLPHPFRGWEGVEDPSYNQPAPNTVNNNRAVELVDGSNCRFAGDGFCDTPPDYLNFRWNCDENGQSPHIQHDPAGVDFVSDGTLFMSYSNNDCPNRFSEEQTAAMRANLLDERFNLLYNQTPAAAIETQDVDLLYPVGDIPHSDELVFEWEAPPQVTHYILQLSPIPTFSIIVGEHVVAGNTFVVGDLDLNRRYFWRVRPFNSHSFCTGFSYSVSFTPRNVTAVKEIEGLTGLSLFPNPLGEGEQLELNFQLDQRLELNISIRSVNGAVLRAQVVQAVAGSNRLRLDTATLPAGAYILGLESAKGRTFARFIRSY